MTNLNSSQKRRKKLIEALQFSYFLFEAHSHLKREYPRSKNPLINSSLKVLDWCRSCQYDQVKDYKQLLKDYPFWESRQYYRERMRKLVADELSTMDFAGEVLHPSLSDTNEALELQEDFRRQATIELDPKILDFLRLFRVSYLF